MKHKEKAHFKYNPRAYFGILVLALATLGFAEDDKKQKIQRLVFEATRIEGQIGTIKALIVTSDKRPEFSPMALQLAHRKLELKNVNKEILEDDRYRDVFPVTLPK